MRSEQGAPVERGESGRESAARRNLFRHLAIESGFGESQRRPAIANPGGGELPPGEKRDR